LHNQANERNHLLSGQNHHIHNREQAVLPDNKKSIKPGYSFGWSAILDGGSYKTDAICAEECEAFNFSRENILDLIDKDHSLGYKLTKQILGVIKTRLDYRTDQFIKVITNHPHMQTFFEK